MHLIVKLKHPDYSIDSRITPACIRSSGSDQILCSAQAQEFSRRPWAGSRNTGAVSFLRNHHKKEHHFASSSCNYHVHHIQSVQRCILVSLFVRHLSSNAEAAGDVKRSTRGVSITTSRYGYSATYCTRV